jgi:hypothetical protein
MTDLPEPAIKVWLHENPNSPEFTPLIGYTAAQMKAYGEACRKAAIAGCIEITEQWGPLGVHFAQTLKELK